MLWSLTSVNGGKLYGFMTVCCVSECKAALVVSDSWQPGGLQPARLLCPWDSPGKSTGVGCHALLQGIFPSQGLNRWLLCLLWLLRWQAESLPLSHLGSPYMVISAQNWQMLASFWCYFVWHALRWLWPCYIDRNFQPLTALSHFTIPPWP